MDSNEIARASSLAMEREIFEFAVDKISGSMESISHANVILGGALDAG